MFIFGPAEFRVWDFFEGIFAMDALDESLGQKKFLKIDVIFWGFQTAMSYPRAFLSYADTVRVHWHGNFVVGPLQFLSSCAMSSQMVPLRAKTLGLLTRIWGR